MLQCNVWSDGKSAHVAHASLVSLHALCCGLPLLAMIGATLSGVSVVSLLPQAWGEFHSFLHARELWILGLSALLLGVGLWLELRALRDRATGFSWLFALSAFCFVGNATLVAAHRLTLF